jgi:hypothetical protein
MIINAMLGDKQHSSIKLIWRTAMIKHLVAMGLLMAALLRPAGAVVSNPGSVPSIPEAAGIAAPVAWVCGPHRCVWRPGWRGRVPAWAMWGPPRLPSCYYERRRRGWVEVCV